MVAGAVGGGAGGGGGGGGGSEYHSPRASPRPLSGGGLSLDEIPIRRKRRRKRLLEAGMCALAVMSSLMVYSVLQERIMTRPYERSGVAALFKHSLFLVLMNRATAVAVSIALILLRGRTSELKSRAPLHHYAAVSVSNVIATSCQYEALKWLTFPTVTIGKCAKMLPVMLILNLRKRRRYRPEDFAIAFAVLSGCAVMISAGRVAVHRQGGAESDSLFGFALMCAYLLFDALTSTWQQRLFEQFDMSVSNQMLFINIASMAISSAALCVSGGFAEALAFTHEFPNVVPDIATLSLSAVAGQYAISYTIQSFGALLYAGIMTTRQFFSVLASDIIFEHGLNFLQWTGAAMVFSSLFFKLWRKAVRDGDD